MTRRTYANIPDGQHYQCGDPEKYNAMEQSAEQDACTSEFPLAMSLAAQLTNAVMAHDPHACGHDAARVVRGAHLGMAKVHAAAAGLCAAHISHAVVMDHSVRPRDMKLVILPEQLGEELGYVINSIISAMEKRINQYLLSEYGAMLVLAPYDCTPVVGKPGESLADLSRRMEQEDAETKAALDALLKKKEG